jgi:AraC-like DNA-binding protein/mannose-6-phosphate isomerase-like protein (cupin superfamily)
MKLYEEQPASFRVVEQTSYNFQLHFHEHIEIICVRSGKAGVQIGNERRVLSAGDYSVAFPNVIHALFVPQDAEPGMITVIVISPALSGSYRRVLTETTPANPFITADIADPDLLYAVNGIVRAKRDGPHPAPDAGAAAEPGSHNGGSAGDTADEGGAAGDEEAAGVYLRLFLMRALRVMPVVPLKERIQSDLTHRLLIYLQKNYMESISLESLAKALHVSKYQISRVMSSQLNTSLPVYLNEIRLAYSMELLMTTDYLVSDISERCGFKSERTFHRAFRAHFGIEPRKVRQNRCANNPPAAPASGAANDCSDGVAKPSDTCGEVSPCS